MRAARWLIVATAVSAIPLTAAWVDSRERPVAEARLTTVALRVHDMRAMEAFYSEAFGVRFRTVETPGGIQSRFGELGGLTIKFVPIRDADDFEGFPVHQLGLRVGNIAKVIDAATRYGGRVQDATSRTTEGLHASIRDPDGNTIELYGK